VRWRPGGSLWNSSMSSTELTRKGSADTMSRYEPKGTDRLIPRQPIEDVIQRMWLDKGRSLVDLARDSGMNESRVRKTVNGRYTETVRRYTTVEEPIPGSKFTFRKKVETEKLRNERKICQHIRMSVADKLITAIDPALWWTEPELKGIDLYCASELPPEVADAA
jgi:hypothetical protein